MKSSRRFLLSVVLITVGSVIAYSSESGNNERYINGKRNYQFDKTISRGVLENYLSRAITVSEILHGIGNPDTIYV